LATRSTLSSPPIQRSYTCEPKHKPAIHRPQGQETASTCRSHYVYCLNLAYDGGFCDGWADPELARQHSRCRNGRDTRLLHGWPYGRQYLRLGKLHLVGVCHATLGGQSNTKHMG